VCGERTDTSSGGAYYTGHLRRQCVSDPHQLECCDHQSVRINLNDVASIATRRTDGSALESDVPWEPWALSIHR
jgi:hypothetical protein